MNGFGVIYIKKRNRLEIYWIKKDAHGGRYWIWTSDFYRVKVALSRWVNRPARNLLYKSLWKYQQKFANTHRGDRPR